MRAPNGILTLLAVGLLAGPIVANAALVDFESAATANCFVTTGGSTNGFTLGAYDGNSGGGFNSATACSFMVPTANSGNQYMVNFNSLIGEFTRDVGTFNLTRLFVHADIRVVGSTTVRFQGLDGVEGNVLFQTDVVILPSTWQQVNFVGWNGVKTFTWDSLIPGTSNIAIDDFEYDVAAAPVPIPAAAWLLLSGLAGLGIAGRRRGNTA